MENKKKSGDPLFQNSSLSIFSEVIFSQSRRGLVFVRILHADEDQNKNRDHIGQHLDQLLLRYADIGNIVVYDEKSSE